MLYIIICTVALFPYSDMDIRKLAMTTKLLPPLSCSILYVLVSSYYICSCIYSPSTKVLRKTLPGTKLCDPKRTCYQMKDNFRGHARTHLADLGAPSIHVRSFHNFHKQLCTFRWLRQRYGLQWTWYMWKPTLHLLPKETMFLQCWLVWQELWT